MFALQVQHWRRDREHVDTTQKVSTFLLALSTCRLNPVHDQQLVAWNDYNTIHINFFGYLTDMSKLTFLCNRKVFVESMEGHRSKSY